VSALEVWFTWRLMKPLVAALLFICVCAVRVQAQPTRVGLERWCGSARISLAGDPGFLYRLEASADPTSPNWDFLATLSLDGGVQTWQDAHSATEARRFYRALRMAYPESSTASDFRLIDQTGRARWLYYNFGAPNVRAVTLIFAGNGCTKLRQMVPTIKALTNRFSPQGVLFWLVDSNTGDNRSNILAEATALGMSNGPPILHDAAQLVARRYRASASTEAVAIDTSNFQIIYRGAIDDRLGTNAVDCTQHYLSNALTQLLVGGVANPRETRVDGCSLSLRPAYPNLSYANDIAPLLSAKCVRCHSEGNVAPFSMTNYQIIQSQSDRIRDEVMTGRMPPWHADPIYGKFTNDSSLTLEEAAKLMQWVEEGAPRGTGPDPLAESPPPPQDFPAGWPVSLGQPDAILRIPLQDIPASGTIPYRYISVFNNAFTNDVWLRAAVARPSNTRVVHHCLVFEGDPNASDGGLAGFYTGYVPGQIPVAFPPGTGKLLKKGQLFTFQMHYTAAGPNQTEQTELGLYVSPVPPNATLQTKSAYSVLFGIPGGAPDYQSTATTAVLSTNITLFEMSPHMHLRGSRFKFEAVYQNGTRETLLSVPAYYFGWQSLYRFTQPKYLPRGTRIMCTANWDNTAQNGALMAALDETGESRYSPTRTVTFGEQSYDEMFIGYLNYAEVPGPLQ